MWGLSSFFSWVADPLKARFYHACCRGLANFAAGWPDEASLMADLIVTSGSGLGYAVLGAMESLEQVPQV